MTQKLDQALAAAKRVRASEVIGVIAALESAQREADAWEAIEQWCKVFDLMRRYIVLMPGKTGYFWELRQGERIENESFVALPDRVTALEDAAEWCREELDKS